MKIWKSKYTRLWMLIVVASTLTFAIGAGLLSVRSQTGIAADLSSPIGHPTGANRLFSPATATPIIEPALTQLATKFEAIPAFSGTVTPGQSLAVRLTQSGNVAPRQPIKLPPKPKRPIVSQRRARVISARIAAPKLEPVNSAALIEPIDCTLLPLLCNDIPLPDPANPTGPAKFKLTNIQPQVEWTIVDRHNNQLVEGQEFESHKLQGLSKSFVLAPLSLAELTPSNAPTEDYSIIVKITVTANKVEIANPGNTILATSAEVPLEVPVNLAALPVPSIFVLFLDKDFTGAAAVYAPADSTLSKTMLPDAVRKVADIYNPVASRLTFVTWFASYLAGLQALQHTFAIPWDLKELKDKESNLNDDDFVHNSPFTHLNDKEVEDESSSLLMLGLPGTGAQFFQNQGLDGKQFSVETGLEMVVLVRDFDNLSTEPPNRICGNTYTNGANDSLSSFKWIRDGSACP